MSVDIILKETKPSMEAVIDDLQRKLANVRTGRANVGILDAVTVDYYGVSTPLNQMASIAVPEPQMLTVQPWDQTQLGAIEKAITAANLGMNPSNDGRIIRLTIPALNEERRKEMVKQAGKYAEAGKVAVRNVRRDANDTLKKMEKDGELTKDDLSRYEGEVQKTTDRYTAEVDAVREAKENEIMEV